MPAIAKCHAFQTHFLRINTPYFLSLKSKGVRYGDLAGLLNYASPSDPLI